MTVERRHEMGAGGYCICPKCSEKTLHHGAIPCQEERCPACGAKLLREDSKHYKQTVSTKTGKKRKKEDLA